MRRPPARGTIRPKISTVPRQKTEDAALLDIYKLVIEKKRLNQELQGIEQRRKQIADRLLILSQHITDLEKTVQQLRQENSTLAEPQAGMAIASTPPTFETLFLEY